MPRTYKILMNKLSENYEAAIVKEKEEEKEAAIESRIALTEHVNKVVDAIFLSSSVLETVLMKDDAETQSVLKLRFYEGCDAFILFGVFSF